LAVEPPLRVEHREELVWLLAQACELEHGLMCEYLFAQFTLKGMDLDDADGFAAVGQARPLTDGDQLMAVPESYQTVGHLYRDIESA